MKFDVFKFSTFDFDIEGQMQWYCNEYKTHFLNVWI